MLKAIDDRSTDLVDVSFISKGDKQRIMDFLQGAVYAWCNVKGNDWFSARDFVGGDNNNWTGLPVDVLYQTLMKNPNNDNNNAVEQAGIAVGKLLKRVLKGDTRTFETRKGFVREYRWNGN